MGMADGRLKKKKKKNPPYITWGHGISVTHQPGWIH